MKSIWLESVRDVEYRMVRSRGSSAEIGKRHFLKTLTFVIALYFTLHGGNTSHGALVVADTATELALGQARQMRGVRPSDTPALPDVPDVVFDHANLLGAQTEEALAKELARVWMNQKIEVFIRTVPREAIGGYEPNALKLVRGRSGNVLVLVLTESASTYLYVMSDPLSSALGLDGVRSSVQNAFNTASGKQPADARIIATVVALLQQIVPKAGLVSASVPTLATPAQTQPPAVSPGPTVPEPAQPVNSGAPLPGLPTTESGSAATDTPSAESANQDIARAAAEPAQPEVPAVPSATAKPVAAPTSGPPIQLLMAGGAAILILAAFFAFPRILRKRTPQTRERSGGLNAPPSSRKTLRTPVVASGPVRFPTRRQPPPEVRPATRREGRNSRDEEAETATSDATQPTQPVRANERAFEQSSVGRPASTAGEPRFSTIRIRRDLTKDEPPKLALGKDEDTTAGPTEPISAVSRPSFPRQPAKATRTPLLRQMGMEPDRAEGWDEAVTAPEGSIEVEDASESALPQTASDTPPDHEASAPPSVAAAAAQDDVLFSRIEAYVASMKRAAPSQRAQMLRGLEILLLAYRERVGSAHPAASQLEIMRG